MAINKYPTSGIIQEMLTRCVPELRGCGTLHSFAKDIYEPYENAVLRVLYDLEAREIYGY